MVKQASCLMGIFFLLSLVSPCWSQTGYPQAPATSDSDRMVYPHYDLFGMPSTTRPDRQMTPSRPVSLPPGVPERQVGSQPASQPATQPATNPATQ